MDDSELLGRIDERTILTHEHIIKIENHLKELNGKVNENCTNIALLEKKAQNNRNLIVAIIGSVLAFITGMVTVLVRHIGLA